MNTITGGTQPITKILSRSLLKRYNKILTNHNLYFLDQLISSSGRHLITTSDFLLRDFDHQSKRFGSSDFFYRLDNIVLECHVQRLIKPEFRLASPLPCYKSISQKPTLNSQTKEIVSTWDTTLNGPTFGKIIADVSNSSHLICYHFTHNINHNNVCQLVKCSGCPLSRQTVSSGYCIITIPNVLVYLVQTIPKQSHTVKN